MPTARRIIFSTQVVATKSIEGEETSIRHTEFLGSTSSDTLNKTLGGKGIAEISASQSLWEDKWTSTTHPLIQNWEEFTTVKWEEVFIHPGESGKQDVSDDPAGFSGAPPFDQGFVYIKNLGDTNRVLVALQGIGSNYSIVIPVGGSICFRGDGTYLDCNDIHLKCDTDKTSEVEYIIARE